MIQNGQKYFNGEFGALTYSVNTYNKEVQINLSLGKTVNNHPFSFVLSLKPFDNKIGKFGKGSFVSNVVDITESLHNYVLKTIYGESILYSKLTASKTIDGITYSYFSKKNGEYLSVDDEYYYLRDLSNNKFKISKDTGIIEEFIGSDNTQYYYDEDNNQYNESLQKKTRFIFKKSTSDTYCSSVEIRQENVLVATALFNYNNDRISLITIKNEKNNIVEQYELSLTEQQISNKILTIKDLTRNKVLKFTLAFALTLEYNGVNSSLNSKTITFSTEEKYSSIISNNGYSVFYTYDNDGILINEIDNLGYAVIYKFDKYRRLIEQSKSVLILSAKNCNNLVDNGNFINGINGYINNAYAENYQGERKSYYLESLKTGNFIKIKSVSDEISTFSKRIDKKGFVGDYYTFLIHYYCLEKEDNSKLQMKIQFYNENNEIVDSACEDISFFKESYLTYNITTKANCNYSYIIVTVRLEGEISLALKEFGVYKLAYGTKLEYGYNGRIIKSIVENNETEYSYNSLSKIAGVLSSNKIGDIIDYDSLNRPIQISDIYGNVRTIEYESDSNEIIKEKIELTNGEIFENNREITRNINEFTKTITTTDAYNYECVSLYSYDGKKILENPHELMNFISYSYNTKDDVISIVEDADNARKNIFTYSSLTREITTLEGPIGNQYRFTYDDIGNILSVEKDNNIIPIVSYTYDSLIVDRAIKKQYGNKDGYELIYDSVGRVVGINYFVLNNGTTQRYEYSYDDMDRIEYVKDVQMNKKLYEYFYNENNKLSKIVLMNGEALEYCYDHTYLWRNNPKIEHRNNEKKRMKSRFFTN